MQADNCWPKLKFEVRDPTSFTFVSCVSWATKKVSSARKGCRMTGKFSLHDAAFSLFLYSIVLLPIALSSFRAAAQLIDPITSKTKTSGFPRQASGRLSNEAEEEYEKSTHPIYFFMRRGARDRNPGANARYFCARRFRENRDHHDSGARRAVFRRAPLTYPGR